MPKICPRYAREICKKNWSKKSTIFTKVGAKCPGAKCPWGILSWGICPWGKMSPNQQSVIIIAEALMALKMYFWDPHNEIKCVLNQISILKFKHLKRSVWASHQ